MKRILITAFILCLPALAAALPCVWNTESPVADTITVDNDYLITAEQMPSFLNGDINTFLKWVAPRIKYPSRQFSKGIHGTVVISFVIDEKGRVKQVEAISSPDEKLTKAVVRAVKQSPNWEPGRNGGKPVAVRQTMPVRFGMPKADDDKAFGVAHNEDMPKFMGGGIDYFSRWVASHIQYPVEAAISKVEGSVVVSFIIDVDGSVVDAKILRSSYAVFNTEALRVVKNSPKWTPGMQDGKPVKVMLNIPVNFRIP